MRIVSASLLYHMIIGAILATAAVVVLSCGSPVDAQAVMRDACNKAGNTTAVDVTIVGNSTFDDETTKAIVEVRIDGRDQHHLTFDQDRNPWGEVILKDGIIYAREITQNGTWGPWDVQGPVSQDPSLPDPTLGLDDAPADGPVGQVDDGQDGAGPARFCGVWNLNDVTHVGSARVGEDDTNTEQFAISTDASEVAGGEDSYNNWGIWVDEHGRILQATQDTFEAEEPGWPSLRVETTITFSGYDEPNVITAPDIP